MRKFRLSVHKYKQKLEATFGFVDPEMVKRYAKARKEWKLAKRTPTNNFNPFTEDPNCKSCRKKPKKRSFEDMIDIHSGATCYIIGKGPGVDTWLQSDSKPENGSISIGINDIGNHVKCDYVVTEVPDIINPLPEASVLFTTNNNNHDEYIKRGWRYFPHQDDPQRTFSRLGWSKEQLVATGLFYSASSTVQHAIHLAWLMGVQEVILIGIDGGSGYCSLITDTKPDTAGKYNLIMKDTKKQLDILFPGKWNHFSLPKKKRQPRKKRHENK